MYGNPCLVTFCLLALVSCIHCIVPSAPFVKNGNSYVSLYGNINAPPPPFGFYEIFEDTLIQYKQSKVSYTELNKFGPALDQLFYFKFLQKLYGDSLSKRVENPNPLPDTVSVPEYTDSENGLDYKELTVYSFPANKRGPKPQFKHDSLRSGTDYQIKNQFTSDNIIITTLVYVDGTKYFVLYHLLKPVYELLFRLKRNEEGIIFAKQSVAFENEDYANTYDSSYSNSSEINAILKKSVTNNVVPFLLSKLSSGINDEIQSQALKLELEHAQKYEKVSLVSFSKAAVEFIKGLVQANNNGNDTFKASDIVYSVDSKNAPLQFQQKTQNIQFKGFLNFVNSKLVYDNTSVSDGGRFYNMSQGVEFTYSLDDEKKAIVSFVISTGRHEYVREFKVKSITIISEYLADLSSKLPNKVYRNKEVFFNKAGFLVRFEIDNADEVYNYVFSHIGNDIARAIQNVVEGSSSTPSVPSDVESSTPSVPSDAA